MAEFNGLNFSQLLTFALKQRLGMIDYKEK